ncbi:MAG: hypothetical protein H0X33_13245 [Taibaiella sp.]|nr:hypothetical protein [Taibaiella sp.]
MPDAARGTYYGGDPTPLATASSYIPGDPLPPPIPGRTYGWGNGSRWNYGPWGQGEGI